MRIFNPEPNKGLSLANFRKVCENGFGDRHNAYPHSMAWFQNHLYVGTNRATFCTLKHILPLRVEVWPIECPHAMYSPEFEQSVRAEIWRHEPILNNWERVYQAPFITGSQGIEISRDLGYRGMVVFQGKSDPKPVLYTSTWSRRHGTGPLILRSEDGKAFLPVSKPGLIGLPITSLRSLVAFKGKLFTAPSSATQGNTNTSIPVIYESRDPVSGEWQAINEPGFGDLNNRTIFSLVTFNDHLYAGTFNNNGFQVWRTLAEGNPPYQWTQVITDGAGRGSLNQIAISLVAFKNGLYVGSAIQNGGYDYANDIGPAGAEMIKIYPDDSWDLIVGNTRNGKRPLASLSEGFNNRCNGYLWRMCTHEGWLYAGTLEWSIFLRYIQFKNLPPRVVRMLEKVGVENVIEHQGGCELWRSYDGENWLPVTKQGFGNPYNYGIRNFVSTSYGLFVGTANPFGLRVATQIDEGWIYTDNPKGGLEIWRGC